MALRQLHGQFTSLTYDSGLVDAGQDVTAVPGFPLLVTNAQEPYGVDLRDDEFLISSVGANINGNINLGTYQKVDLRDIFNDRECMDNLVINVQRHLESPVPSFWVNMGLGPIIETFVILNGDADCTPGGGSWLNLTGGRWHTAGFDNIGVSGNYENCLYRETRRYVPNNTQAYRSTTDMGSYVGLTGTIAGQQNNHWLAAYQMESRTVGGYPSKLVGPTMTIIRAWTLYPANRSDRSVNGGGPNDVEASNWSSAEGRMQLTIPMLQWNIVGNRRAMTDDEIAVEYSNRLLFQ